MKIQLFSLSGLWFDLQKILWPFFIFLRSLMPKKSSGMQKILFLNRISPQKINKPKIPFYSTVRPAMIGIHKKNLKIYDLLRNQLDRKIFQYILVVFLQFSYLIACLLLYSSSKSKVFLNSLQATAGRNQIGVRRFLQRCKKP